MTEGGEEIILRFHLPGSLLGIRGINSGYYHATATTLDTCSVCELPFALLQQFPDQTSVLNHQLLRLVCREIDYDQQLMLLLRKPTARQKVAGFVLNLADHFAQNGYSMYEFNLPMSRIEIANHLNVARETLSRVFQSFEKASLLRIRGKYVRLFDRGRLLAICNTHDNAEQSARSRILHKESLVTIGAFENRG